MKTLIVQNTLWAQKADAWIVLVGENGAILPKSSDALGKRAARMIEGWIATTGFKGRIGEVTSFPTWESLPIKFVLLAGLGPSKDLHPGRVSRALGAAARAAKRLDLNELAVSVSPAAQVLSMSEDALVQRMILGAAGGRYDFSKFSTSNRKAKEGEFRLAFADVAPGNVRALRATAANYSEVAGIFDEVRDLANLPGNEAPPMTIARYARQMAKTRRVSCKVMGRDELRRKGCGSLLAVAEGSNQEPCLITLKYAGRNPALKPLVLIGKTITFDTGGICIKPAKGMEWMRYDKGGGMAVLAAILAAAALKAERPVVAMLAAAENMPGGKATRPGDIVKSHSGKTIEVINTDAEGRLVLADALSMAASHKPAAIVDVASLTGACIIAFGHVYSGIMGSDSNLVSQLCRAGERSGDLVWPMPLVSEYSDGLRSHFADVRNVAAEGVGGAIMGGAFLEEFVPADIPWAHLDIAGTVAEEREQSHAGAGATLFGARLLVEWIQSFK